MVDYDVFVNAYFPVANESKKADIKRFLDNLSEVIGDRDVKESLQDEEVLKKAFYIHKASSISRSGYEKIKAYLSCLLRYYEIQVDIPSWADVMKSPQVSCFFKDLTSACEFVDRVGNRTMNGYNPKEDFLVIKAIVILGWHGLSCKQIAEVKKKDIVFVSDGEYTYKNDSGVTFHLTQMEFEVLYLLSALEEYRGLGGRTQIFRSDPTFLFRSSKKASKDMEFTPPVNEAFIAQRLTDFNSIIPQGYNSVISFRRLRLNALFVHIYEKGATKQRDFIEEAKQFMGCDNGVANAYKRQYRVWEEMFHPED